MAGTSRNYNLNVVLKCFHQLFFKLNKSETAVQIDDHFAFAKLLVRNPPLKSMCGRRANSTKEF